MNESFFQLIAMNSFSELLQMSNAYS